MPIRHIVILNFRKNDQIDYIQLMGKTRPLIENMNGVTEYSIYKNESKHTPDNIFSVGVQIDFEDKKSLDSFMETLEANALFEKHLANPPFSVLTHHF